METNPKMKICEHLSKKEIVIHAKCIWDNYVIWTRNSTLMARNEARKPIIELKSLVDIQAVNWEENQ